MSSPRIYFPLFVAAAALLVSAAPAPPPLTFDTVSRPLSFAGRLLGRPAPEIVEAQAVPLPGVAQYGGVALYFAPHAHATDRAGLCRLEMQHVVLDFVEPRDQAGTLLPSPPETIVFYALTGPAPDLGVAGGDRAVDEAACRGLTPFLNRENWHLAVVTYDGRPANPAQAAFAFRVVAAARAMETFQSRPCPSGDGAVCVDARAYLRAVDLRDPSGLSVARCAPDAPNLCVTATIDDPLHGGYVDLRAETDVTDIPAAGAPLRVRAVAITAGRYPVA